MPSSASICFLARVPTSLSRAPLVPRMIAFWLGRSTYSSACTSVRPSRPGWGPISSTTTAIECGSSSRTPSSAASRMSSATSSRSGSSVSSPSGYSGLPSGRWDTSTSASTSRLNPVTADTGTTSAHSPSRSTAASWATTWSGDTSSVLVTMATTGVPLIPASSRARYRSPGPIASPAGIQKPMTSTSVSVERTRLSSRSPSSVRGLCRPGVSTTMSWASGRCTMPRITRRVVCGGLLVIATLAPTSAFMRVDLPTFGRPVKHAKPERKPACAPAPAASCDDITPRFSRIGRAVGPSRPVGPDRPAPGTGHRRPRGRCGLTW